MSIGSFSEVKKNSGMLHIQASAEDESVCGLGHPRAQGGCQSPAPGHQQNPRLVAHPYRAGRGQAGTHRGQGGAAAAAQLPGRGWRDARQIMVRHQPAGSQPGRARPSDQGGRVGGGAALSGAFYKKVYGNQADVWIRTASKHFNPADYPDSEVSSRTGGSSGFVGENSDRFPLAKPKSHWTPCALTSTPGAARPTNA